MPDMFTRSRLKDRRAMTLVELLIAIVLITFLMWPLFQVFKFSARGSLKTGDLTTAINTAAAMLELLKNKPFNALIPGDASGLKEKMDETDVSAYLEKCYAGKYPTDAGRFLREVLITPLSETPTARGKEFMYIQIVVNVYWTDKGGAPKGPVSLFAVVPNENMALR